MPDYIDTQDLPYDICHKIIGPKASIEEVREAVEQVIDVRLANPPSLADLVAFTDSSGQELAAALSSAPHLDRSTFVRALVGALSKDALADLHAELMRG